MRVGSIGYSTQQGISLLMKWFHDAGVITDVMTFRHGSRPSHPEWYPEGTIELVGRPFNGSMVDEWLKPLDVVLFFETPFDDTFYEYCRVRGVKTVLVPMYECYPRAPRGLPDAFVNPSLLDQRDYWPGAPFIQIPVPPDVVWRQRTTATRFLHNAGNLGLRGHKGTLEILRAWRHVKSDATLTVRAQDTAALSKALSQAPEVKRDDRVDVVLGEVPREELFDASHDVFLMAEKYNGLSMPLIEARAAGMLVVTSDRFPTNTWLPREPLIPVKSYSRQCVSGAYQTYDEALVTPEAIAETVDRLYGMDITEYSLQGKAWAEANSWEKLNPVWLEQLRKVVGS